MSGSKTITYLSLIRFPQYLKNLIIFAPLFFGGRLFHPPAAWSAWWAFACFCLTASAVYIFNDLKDADYDRAHPVKKERPIASGAVAPGRAAAVMVLLLVLSLGLGAVFLELPVLGMMAAYFLVNLLYSWRLKHLPVVDVLLIGLFFVLRVFIGGAAAGVPVSHWLVLMAFLLALFLALAKRRDDLVLAARGSEPRPSIDGYNLEFVSAGLNILAGVLIVCYLLYTISPEVMAKHSAPRLYLTVFWVIAGLLRYLQLTLVREESGSPTKVLLRDRFLQAVVLLWVINLFFTLYGFKGPGG